MGDATYLIPHFLGGEVSQLAQGRSDKPDYRTSLNVCLNSFPVEIGAWTRRPGTRHAGTTRNGAPGRVIKFDYKQATAVTLEFTDGYLRIRSGPDLVKTSGGAALELITPYVGGSWANVRTVQAETTDILLCPTVVPQALTAKTVPPAVSATFALAPAVFNDGPYLDPFTNGVQATPSAKLGIIGIALGFPSYDAAKSYKKGAFVTDVGVNYISLVDQNVGHTPAALGGWWATTTAGAAINDGRGFLGTDIGRLVRLFSEPPAWVVGTTYAVGNVVSYNPTGLPGATTYWQAAAISTGVPPGSNLTSWTIIPSGAAIWTWGRVTSLTNVIDRALAGSVNMGDMTAGGGVAAAFNGQYSQISGSCAALSVTGGAAVAGQVILQSNFVGKDYSGASNQVIQQATVYPSSNQGFAAGTYIDIRGTESAFAPFITLNLRGKATPPLSSSDGTLLGASGVFANSTAPVTITSTDQATAWKYVWIEQITQVQIGGAWNVTSYFFTTTIAQVSFFNPAGTGSSAGANVEILGPPLLYTSAIQTWRLGVYSDTTGYPTCGTYYEGRLWLGGAIANRFDASVSNGIDGATVNFAPTDQNGVVAANAAISYVMNSDSSNPMFWMQGEEKGITIGTQAGEWLVVAPTNGPLSQTNIAARRVTKHGSANIEPRRTEHTLVFVKRYARKLLEFFSDANFGKFSAPNLADKAGHIVSPGIAELAYTEAVTPILWGRDNAGNLFGITYKRDTLTTAQPPTFAAWHRHSLGSGRVVESICGGPSVGGDLDALTMVTNDPATGIRHVEIMTDVPSETAALSASWFLDNAIVPSSNYITYAASTSAPYGSLTLLGLDHLNGKTVQIFAGGLDLGDRGPDTSGYTDFVIANGVCIIPFGDGLSAGPGGGLFTVEFVQSFAAGIPIVVGFTYNSDAQMVRPIAPADTGARTGPALGATRRSDQYSVLVNNTLGISFGGTFPVLRPAQFRQANGNPIAPLTMFSGIHHDRLDDDYSYDSMVCWRVSRPWPANVVAFSANIQTQDR
jgi:hypothetical protein